MKTVVRETALVLGIALVATVFSAFFHPKRPAWYRVEAADVTRWSISEEEAIELNEAGKVLWVDARPAKKYAESHYENAISLDLENWGELMFESQTVLQDAIGHPVIVYCDGTRCQKSKEVAQEVERIIEPRTCLFIERQLAKHREVMAIECKHQTQAALQLVESGLIFAWRGLNRSQRFSTPLSANQFFMPIGGRNIPDDRPFKILHNRALS